MPPKQRKITEVLMQCHRYGWIGPVFECNSDSDYPEEPDGGRLRCPKCQAVVNQIAEMPKLLTS